MLSMLPMLVLLGALSILEEALHHFSGQYLVQVQPEKWCSASSNIPLSIFLFDSFNLDLVSMNEAFVHARTIFQVGTLYNEESIHIGNISTQS